MVSGQSQQVQNSLMTMRILWGAMLASHGLYLFMGYVLAGRAEPMVITENGLERTIQPAMPIFQMGLEDSRGLGLAGLALAMIVMSFVLPRIVAKASPGATPAMAASVPVDVFLPRKVRAFIVGLAINESAAIFGLLAVLLLQNFAFGSALIYLSLAAMVTRFPTQESLMQDRAKYGAVLPS